MHINDATPARYLINGIVEQPLLSISLDELFILSIEHNIKCLEICGCVFGYLKGFDCVVSKHMAEPIV